MSRSLSESRIIALAVDSQYSGGYRTTGFAPHPPTDNDFKRNDGTRGKSVPILYRIEPAQRRVIDRHCPTVDSKALTRCPACPTVARRAFAIMGDYNSRPVLCDTWTDGRRTLRHRQKRNRGVQHSLNAPVVLRFRVRRGIVESSHLPAGLRLVVGVADFGSAAFSRTVPSASPTSCCATIS